MSMSVILSAEQIDQLCNQWIRLVPWVVDRHSIPHLSRGRLAELGGRCELVAVGNLALVEAARKFDPSYISKGNGRRAQFQTFAVLFIRRALWAYCTREDSQPLTADYERLPSKEAEPHVEASANEQAAHVANLLDRLPARHRHVIRARFFAERTLKDIGTDLGISRERIRQIEADALERMQAMVM